MIKPESIENLKSIIDIVDVVGNYVQLKKQGSNYIALCPFHSEKTPSFVVSPSKQIYHCFGCSASGDAIKFIMEIEKLSYPEAIEKLANMYNFKLEYTSSSSTLKVDILEKVNAFYIQELYKNSFAYEYLKQRGINDSTIEKFALGYAPSSLEQFKFFKNANLNKNELITLGVLSENGEYPRLIERITFPIFSSSGKIIAFGGRTITNHPAKYINFTNTKIFNKSKTFYGLNFAREHILRKKEAIIVEGYMDVIMLHQAGFTNAIATLGTALTPQHLPQLKKLNAKILLSYDSDSAGINAALKASKLLFKDFFEGGVILFPQGLDPADVVKKGEDLDKYPKKFEADSKICELAGVDYIFAPNIEDMYDNDEVLIKAPQIKGYILEGHFRPGHFDGVLQIVLKLFNIVKPKRAYFGKKDAQQLSLIKRMVKNFFLDIEIVEGETVREKSGLALSSRNAYLSEEEKKRALSISKSLKLAAKLSVNEKKFAVIKEKMLEVLEIDRVQYIACVDRDFNYIEEIQENNSIILIAGFVGTTRLIDNIFL